MKRVGRWESFKDWWNNTKFEVSIKAIFVFAVVVSFSHTIELYRSVGFDVDIDWINNLLGVDCFNLALFATLAAEAAFAVGLWGLYEAYEERKGFPSVKEYWQIWTLFGCGLLVVGWSNVGGTVGYDFIIGQPVKGIVLGCSIPAFVLGTVLVNFKRKHPNDTEDTNEGTQTNLQETANITWHEQTKVIPTLNENEQSENTPTPTIQKNPKGEKEVSEESVLMEKETLTTESEKQREKVSTEDLENVASTAEDGDQDKIEEDEIPKSEQKTEKEEKEEKQPASLDEKRDELAHVEKIARDIWKKEGKRPGRVKIETETKCSEKTSRKIAKKLLEEEKRKAKAG
ncbi:hypothetical protein ACFQ5F_09845 [Kroppenstedtia eburnea]|uniref:hypothetical protein n=1 Tax=Kroppenstedtia eburnea TaxID=714067 RepID=UPI0036424ED7